MCSFHPYSELNSKLQDTLEQIEVLVQLFYVVFCCLRVMSAKLPVENPNLIEAIYTSSWDHSVSQILTHAEGHYCTCSREQKFYLYISELHCDAGVWSKAYKAIFFVRLPLHHSRLITYSTHVHTHTHTPGTDGPVSLCLSLSARPPEILKVNSCTRSM